MVAPPLRLGTRRSALATAQAREVARALERASRRDVELVLISSEGDTNRASLREIGGRGIFASRLRDAMLTGECDLLVHSLKDLPAQDDPRFVIAATPVRADARDVVVTRDGTPLHELSDGATVGTGSPRRIAQTRRRAHHTQIVDIRGNVDSRLRRVATGELDAVIVAAAGLARLDPDSDLFAESLGMSEWPTAPGQGALALETVVDAPTDLLAAISSLNDPATRLAVTVERAVLEGLGAGCQAPMAAHAEESGDDLRVRAVVYSPSGEGRVGDDIVQPLTQGYILNQRGDGAIPIDGESQLSAARELGLSLANRLLDRGAAHLAPHTQPL